MANDGEMDYTNFHHALLLGEADFSFASAFGQEFEGSITATEYGSGLDIANRYHDGCTATLDASLKDLVNVSSARNIRNIQVVSALDAKALGDKNNCLCERWNMNGASSSSSWDPPTPFWGSSNHTPLFDIVIFNFPHSAKTGKSPKLLRYFFKQLRLCVNDGRLPRNVIVEMRLRDDAAYLQSRGLIRAPYKHEEAAAESLFELIGTFDNDLPRWEKLGYEHKTTKRNASCRAAGGGLFPCNVWRWRPKEDTIMGTCRTDGESN